MAANKHAEYLADRVMERNCQQIEPEKKLITYRTNIQEFIDSQAKEGVVFECGGDAFEAFMKQNKVGVEPNNVI
jgi:hypothetical protein